MPALQPFDRHPANVGALESSASRLTKQAAQAIDAHRLTFLAFAPAVQNWDGIAAPELRAAPRPVRQQAFAISDSLAWGATALRYWAGQVQAFNTRVDQIMSQLFIARMQILNADNGCGVPLSAAETAEANQAVRQVAERDWRQAYQTHILDGGRTAAGMLNQGPTDRNVFAASSVGLLPPGKAWNPLNGMWDAFKGSFVPPGGYGPLGPWPWLGGRAAFATGVASALLRQRHGYVPGYGWLRNGSHPRLHPRTQSLVDRAAKAARRGGAITTVAGSLSRRLHEGASLPRAAAGAATESAGVLGCAAGAARAMPAPHLGAKAAAGFAGGVACSEPAKWVGDKVSGLFK